VLAIPKHLRESWAERVAIMVADDDLACEEADIERGKECASA
jgi:hypothetical protein